MYRVLSIPHFFLARHYGEVASTMDVARDIVSAESTRDDWCGVVTADAQTSGRGRQGRRWLSGRAAFMGTFMFATSLPVAQLSGYSLAVGVALAEGLRTLDIPTRLKWPNDLVQVEEGRLRKLGGILIEVQEIAARRCVLVGIGINNGDLPVDVSVDATSIRVLTGHEVDLALLSTTLSSSLYEAHHRFTKGGGFCCFAESWRALTCFRPGSTWLEIDRGDSQVNGIYQTVSDLGALVLEVNGSQEVVHSGHVVRISL